MVAFGDPRTQVAFSVFENKGVFALLLGSGVSRAAEIPTGWEITTDLVRRIATAEGMEEQADWAQWYRGECLKLCVSDRVHAVFRYVQASKRPVNIMAS
jgi:hypothetical protein